LNRQGKSCRLRWLNYLRPNVKRGRISPDEEELIIRLHKLLGNRWSLIAARVPGRTDNDVKNFWNIHLSKKLGGKGIQLNTRKSKPKDTVYTNVKSSEDSTNRNINSLSTGDKNLQRNVVNVALDSIVIPAESKQLQFEHPCNSNTVHVQQNSYGICESCVQFVDITTSNQCHAIHTMPDSVTDSFWFGSLPWLDFNDGDYLDCNYTASYITEMQPNNLISEFDMWL
ncbi:hypothetical protein KI387_002134, partial [Taxus chinensis]